MFKRYANNIFKLPLLRNDRDYLETDLINKIKSIENTTFEKNQAEADEFIDNYKKSLSFEPVDLADFHGQVVHIDGNSTFLGDKYFIKHPEVTATFIPAPSSAKEKSKKQSEMLKWNVLINENLFEQGSKIFKMSSLTASVLLSSPNSRYFVPLSQTHKDAADRVFESINKLSNPRPNPDFNSAYDRVLSKIDFFSKEETVHLISNDISLKNKLATPQIWNNSAMRILREVSKYLELYKDRINLDKLSVKKSLGVRNTKLNQSTVGFDIPTVKESLFAKQSSKATLEHVAIINGEIKSTGYFTNAIITALIDINAQYSGMTEADKALAYTIEIGNFFVLDLKQLVEDMLNLIVDLGERTTDIRISDMNVSSSDDLVTLIKKFALWHSSLLKRYNFRNAGRLSSRSQCNCTVAVKFVDSTSFVDSRLITINSITRDMTVEHLKIPEEVLGLDSFPFENSIGKILSRLPTEVIFGSSYPKPVSIPDIDPDKLRLKSWEFIPVKRYSEAAGFALPQRLDPTIGVIFYPIYGPKPGAEVYIGYQIDDLVFNAMFIGFALDNDINYLSNIAGFFASMLVQEIPKYVIGNNYSYEQSSTQLNKWHDKYTFVVHSSVIYVDIDAINRTLANLKTKFTSLTDRIAMIEDVEEFVQNEIARAIFAFKNMREFQAQSEYSKLEQLLWSRCSVSKTSRDPRADEVRLELPGHFLFFKLEKGGII